MIENGQSPCFDKFLLNRPVSIKPHNIKLPIKRHTVYHLIQDSDNEYAMIDSTIVRAHQHAVRAGAAQKASAPGIAIGRSKGGLSTKIHTICDALGNPLSFHLTLRQACDLDGFDVLLPELQAELVLADKGYDADERVTNPLQVTGKTVVIPPKSNRMVLLFYDKTHYKARQLIEVMCEKFKYYRAIATCYGKIDPTFLGAIHLAAWLLWLN